MLVGFKNQKDFGRMATQVRRLEHIPRKFTVLPTEHRDTQPSVESGDTYNGPWQTIKDPDNANKVIVKAYDGTTYYAKNIIHAGTATDLIISSDQTVTITTTGVVYCTVSWNLVSEQYEAAFANAANLPNPSNGSEPFQIAAVDLTDGVATVKAQIQRSDYTPTKAI